MPNLLSTLYNSASALEAYQRVLEVSQSNVANASTPGYAKQLLRLNALPFDPSRGLPGGVEAGQMESTRNEYAEQAVRRQSTQLGQQQQAATSLTAIQAIFDISGTTGIPNALNQFFQSVSAWGQNLGSTAARQTVLERAADVAQNFQSAATRLQDLTRDTETQLHSTVDQVNKLVDRVRQYNGFILQTGSASHDMGMDAQVHAALEDLSTLVDFTAVQQTDGTTTILLNGRTPLLIEDRQFALSATLVMPDDPVNPTGAPRAQVVAADGTDLTSQTIDGQLGALLDIRNRILPSIAGDAAQTGDLNRLAKQFADRVNDLLSWGNVSDGPPPVSGVPLFQYDTGNLTATASTLAVDPTVAPDQLAAIDPGPPYVGNGVPLAIAQLAMPGSDDDRIDGISYAEFYGKIAAGVGNQLQAAQEGQQVQQSLVAQAKNQRQQLSGVSLDEEAMILVEFQRAYEANSKFITVLDQLTQDTLDILR
ncbi:MAG TPA: flagellar hook-associated protein FlgK [Bryobacteraceae bacterium]